MSEEILLISDMHVMSFWGLIHPDYEDDNGTSYRINSMNLFSQNHWNNMINECRNISAVIVNGDIIDGINPGNYGAVANTDPYEQIKMSSLYFDDFNPNIPIYMTKGTKWHSGEEIVAEKLVADYIDATYEREGIIEECGIRIWANHYSSHARNKASMLERKLNEVAAAEKYCGGHIDVVLRSHNHTFSAVHTRDQIGIMTPGWQHKTPYAIDRDLIIPPDIGYVKIIIDDGLITVDRRGVIVSPFGCQVM